MLAKRIIPCLDVTAGRVVKGVNFVSLRDAGDPVEIARRYNEEGADELTFLDITASSDQRDIILSVIEAVAGQVFIPLTVGGGVRKVSDIRRLLNAGADKISINTAGVNNPDLIGESAALHGSQCIVVAIDARRRDKADPSKGWEVYTHGGRTATGLDAVEWAKKVTALGAGEILLEEFAQVVNIHRLAVLDKAVFRQFADIDKEMIVLTAVTAAIEHHATHETIVLHIVLKFTDNIGRKVLASAGIRVILVHIGTQIAVQRAL